LSARRFKLTRVGASPGQAIFTCDRLLGQEIEVVDAKDYDKVVNALNEVMPRYCELFEAAGLGDSSISVAVQIAREAL
jgi:hypothetical protein